jgi:ribosomal protein L10
MGQQVLDKKSVTALASLPSLDQLRAKIVGLLQAPATKIAGVLQAPAVSWLASWRPTPPKTPPDRHFPTKPLS